jgi:hypothetical protein
MHRIAAHVRPQTIALLVVLLAGGSAWADTVTFNFTGGTTPPAGVTSLTFTGTPAVPPLSLIASATAGGNVTQSSIGLGVSGRSNAFEIENNETLQFDFTPNTVTINTIRFSDVDLMGNDDAATILRVTSPTKTLFSGVISSTAGTITLNLAPWASAADRTGLKFSVSGIDGNDDFAIGKLTMDYTPPVVVPLPSAGVSGAAIFAGCGILSCLRRRSAA